MLNQYLIQLMLSKGIGEVALKKIINVVPEREWQTLCESPHLLGNIINCRGNTIESVLLNKDRAGQLYLKMQKNSIAMIERRIRKQMSSCTLCKRKYRTFVNDSRWLLRFSKGIRKGAFYYISMCNAACSEKHISC